jgi:hypothetical protein
MQQAPDFHSRGPLVGSIPTTPNSGNYRHLDDDRQPELTFS